MMVGRLLSYWEGSFSGAMLNFRRVRPNPSQPWGLFYGFQGQRLSFSNFAESVYLAASQRAPEMFPNRNLVGAGVGHVEEDSITSWYGRYHIIYRVFRGDHFRPYILRDIPEYILSKHGVCHICCWNDMALRHDFWRKIQRYTLALFFKHDSSCWDVVGFPSLSCWTATLPVQHVNLRLFQHTFGTHP